MSGRPLRLVLVGGGHAHVGVIADLVRSAIAAEIVLITPSPTLRYSGMVPGWISGRYDRDQGVVDLAGLASRAGIDLICDRCVAIDPKLSEVETASGQRFGFDYCSINSGGVGRAHAILGEDERIIDVRPIDRFVEHIGELAKQAPSSARRLAIVGGGAAGVELAFALRHRFAASLDRIALITGSDGLLPSFGAWPRTLVVRELARQAIEVIERDAKISDGVLQAGGSALEPIDAIVAALGSGAPDWPRSSGLATDSAGYLLVDEFQRSISHPHILATGDIAMRQDCLVPHSGVHAVHSGPKLAATIRALFAGRRPRASYRPRSASLYLLDTANGSAIAAYGPLAAQGVWVRNLKHWIDKRWIDTYAELARAV